MRKNFVLLALVAMLVVPATANAAANVWFQMASGDGTVLSGGAEGTPLVIEKSDAPGAYTFTLEMWATNLDATTGIYSVSTDLVADGPVAATSAATFMGSGAWAFPSLNGVAEGPGMIVDSLGAGQFMGAGFAAGASIKLADLTLSVTQPMTDKISIFAGIGGGLWGSAVSTGVDVSFGGNQALDGTDAAALDSAPCIVIQNVPEPATMALLGFGALALIRRRR